MLYWTKPRKTLYPISYQGSKNMASALTVKITDFWGCSSHVKMCSDSPPPGFLFIYENKLPKIISPVKMVEIGAKNGSLYPSGTITC